MPVARIFTSHPEYAASLSGQLQAQGFTVEVMRPGDAHLSPADLEIEFEVYDQQRALERAAELASRWQSDIVVFPGAVQPRPQVVPEAQSVVPVETPRAASSSSLVQPQRIEPQRVQPQRIEPERMVEPQTAVAPPPVVQEQGKVVAFPPLEQSAVSEPATKEASPAEATAGPGRESLENVGRELRKSWQQTRDAFSEAGGELGRKWQGARRKMGGSWVRMKTSFARRNQEHRERMQARAAEAETARQQRMAELERERIAAQERAAELEHQRRIQKQLEEAVRQELMERERIEREERMAALERQRLAASQQRQPQQPETAAPVQPQAEQPAPIVQPIMRRRPMARRRRHLELNGVLTGAIAISFLFLVGLTLANFHPWSPLPAHLSQSPSLEQHLPFGPATAHASAPVPPPVRPAIHPRPPVQPPQAAPASKTPVAAQKPQPQHRLRRTHRNQDDSVADDVVVRHFPTNSTAPKQAQSRPQSGQPKRYSDM